MPYAPYKKPLDALYRKIYKHFYFLALSYATQEKNQCVSVSEDVCRLMVNVVKDSVFKINRYGYNFPRGCITMYKGERVYYNTNEDYEAPCTSERKCICKKGIQRGGL